MVRRGTRAAYRLRIRTPDLTSARFLLPPWVGRVFAPASQEAIAKLQHARPQVLAASPRRSEAQLRRRRFLTPRSRPLRVLDAARPSSAGGEREALDDTQTGARSSGARPRRAQFAPAPGLEPSGIVGKPRDGEEKSGSDATREARNSRKIGYGAADFAARQSLFDAHIADAVLATALAMMAERLRASFSSLAGLPS